MSSSLRIVAICIFIISGCSNHEKKGTEDTGGGDLIKITEKNVISHARKAFDRFIRKDSQKIIAEFTNLSPNQNLSKVNTALYLTLDFGEWVTGKNNSFIDTNQLIGHLNLKEYRKVNFDLFLSDSNYVFDNVFEFKSTCYAPNRLASVSSFNKNAKICFDMQKMGALPAASYEDSFIEIMLHEICHLNGYEDHQLCNNIQTTVMKAIKKNSAERYSKMSADFYTLMNETYLAEEACINLVEEECIFQTYKFLGIFDFFVLSLTNYPFRSLQEQNEFNNLWGEIKNSISSKIYKLPQDYSTMNAQSMKIFFDKLRTDATNNYNSNNLRLRYLTR